VAVIANRSTKGDYIEAEKKISSFVVFVRFVVPFAFLFRLRQAALLP
jgi:hypothetical protein